jgi:hypothetical protein
MGRAFVASALVFLLAGCSATQFYEGPRRDASEVAVVHDDVKYYVLVVRHARVVSTDGDDRHRFGSTIELLPGDHVLGVRFGDYRFGFIREAKTLCYVKFRAEAGHEYKFDSETFNVDNWRIWLVDQQTGARCDCLYGPPKTEAKAESLRKFLTVSRATSPSPRSARIRSRATRSGRG